MNTEEKKVKEFIKKIIKRLDAPVEAVPYNCKIPTELELASDIYTILNDEFNSPLLIENNKIYISIKDAIFELTVKKLQ